MTKQTAETVLALYRQGQVAEARAVCEALLTITPRNVHLLTLLGATQMQQRNFAAAANSFKSAITYRPRQPNLYNNLGVALLNLNAFDQSIAALQQAIRFNPEFAQAYNNLGKALKQKGQLVSAAESFRKAVVLNPVLADAHNNLGEVLRAQGVLEEALEAYHKALMVQPKSPELYYNIGKVFMEEDRLEAAQEAYQKSISLNPQLAEVHNNLAITLKRKGQLKAAISAYDRALTINPELADAREGKAFTALLQGKLLTGFELMEARMYKKDNLKTRPPRPGLIRDKAQSLQKAHILVYAEQGLGDTLQFCRYLPLLEARGAKVTFQVTSKLHNILCTLDCQTLFVETLPPSDCIDFEIPLMSLPYHLDTDLDSVPASTAYLNASVEKLELWRGRLTGSRFNIGICWQGGTSKIDTGRSFPLALFAPLAALPRVELVSLHKGAGEDQLTGIDFNVTYLGPDFDIGESAFSDTAAVMQACDLIITSDTSVAHLAGALGCPTWVALKSIPDWRWMMERTDSPWYPAMTLYRQKIRGDWGSVFEDMERDLSALLHQEEL